MLRPFDIIRRVNTGTELVAALRLLPQITDWLDELDLGQPYSGCFGPCTRCWIYPQQNDSELCQICAAITVSKEGLHELVSQLVVIWGYSTTPCWDFAKGPLLPDNTIGHYMPDPEHFFILAPKKNIKAWLQSLALQYGEQFKGLLQLVPTMGKGERLCMGDVISRAVHQETVKLHDACWVRFFPQAWQILEAKKLDEKGQLTYQLSDFIDFMEGARVFHTVLPRRSRDMLHELLTGKIENVAFYWGRFLRNVDQQTRDLIDAWQLRTWSIPKIDTLYQLREYVYPTKNH